MNPLKSRKVQAAGAAFIASVLLVVASNLGLPITEDQAQILGAKAVALAMSLIGGVAIEDHARHAKGNGGKPPA